MLSLTSAGNAITSRFGRKKSIEEAGDIIEIGDLVRCQFLGIRGISNLKPSDATSVPWPMLGANNLLDYWVDAWQRSISGALRRRRDRVMAVI